MQPNTVNTHHDTDPHVPPELLEAMARALAAALIPPPRRPPPPETEEAADFLTAAQLARRLGVSRETVRRAFARQSKEGRPGLSAQGHESRNLRAGM